MSLTTTIVTDKNCQFQQEFILARADQKQHLSLLESSSQCNVTDFKLFLRTLQWCLQQNDSDARITLANVCANIADCPTLQASIQCFVPLISEYLKAEAVSVPARQELIALTNRSLEALSSETKLN